MPLPKRRHSKSRRDKSRTHQGLVAPSISTCSHCGAAKLPHRVCPACGYYNNRPVVEIKEKKEKKKK